MVQSLWHGSRIYADPGMRHLEGILAVVVRGSYKNRPAFWSFWSAIKMGRRQGGPSRTGVGGSISEPIRDRRATQTPAHFIANFWAVASWLFFRVARSPRMTQIWALRSRLEKQPTDLRQSYLVFRGQDTRRIRVAALADCHYTKASAGLLKDVFARASQSADVLVLCGDMTDYGLPEEAAILAQVIKTYASR